MDSMKSQNWAILAVSFCLADSRLVIKDKKATDGIMREVFYMGKGVTLSVCMIVRDESPVLCRCLDGVKVFADEIIIVDTGSLDDTKEIALRYTDKVYDFPWIDDFAAARNVSYSYATMDYVMWIDADDVVSPEDAERLKTLKTTLDPETDVVFLLYGNAKDQKDIWNNTFIFRDRWAKRSLNPTWHGRLHEWIEYPKGDKSFFARDIMLRHCKVRVNDPDRNMRIHKLCLSEGTEAPNRDAAFLCGEYSSKGDFEKAIAVFDELTDKDPFPKDDVCNALFSYIWSMKQIKKTDELIDKLRLLEEKGIADEMLLSELGGLYLARSEYDNAEKYLLKALDTPVDYQDMRIHFEAYHEFVPCQKLAKLYVALGKMDASYEYFKRAEKIYPENTSVRLSRMYYNKNMDLK